MPSRTFLAIGCTHRPVHDEDYCDWVIDQIKEQQPDCFYHLGDLFDATAISRFDSFAPTTLQEEYESADIFLQRINQALPPTSSRTYMLGNHEDRIWASNNKAVSDLIRPRRHLDSLHGWKMLKYVNSPSCVARLGQVSFSHGFMFSERSKAVETIHFGVPYGLHVRSHTHRGYGPQQLKWGAALDIPYWHANTGCGIKSDEGYFQTMDTSQWNRGLIHGWSNPHAKTRYKCHWEADFMLHSNLWETKV